MSNHTPGPWVLNGYQIERTTGIARTIGLVRSQRVLGTDSAAKTEQEALANARLIVAAPDMLETLRATAKWVALQGEVPGCGPAAESMGRIIAAAIAKAEGRNA